MEKQAATRHRIVEAVVALHREVGPARTTITAIAERASVERLTVYRHFADETSLFTACSAHFVSETSPPDPAAWARIRDPSSRLGAALTAFYGYYRRGEDMLTHVFRDAPLLPAMLPVLEPWFRFVAITRADLVAGWGVRGLRRARLTASIGHALRFESWKSLAREEGLEDADVVELMVALATAASSSAPGGRAGRHPAGVTDGRTTSGR